jgi:hypothetical protein
MGFSYLLKNEPDVVRIVNELTNTTCKLKSVTMYSSSITRGYRDQCSKCEDCQVVKHSIDYQYNGKLHRHIKENNCNLGFQGLDSIVPCYVDGNGIVITDHQLKWMNHQFNPIVLALHRTFGTVSAKLFVMSLGLSALFYSVKLIAYNQF